MKSFGEKGEWAVSVSRDCPNCLGAPFISGTEKSKRFQIWPVHSEGPSEQKPIKNFRQKGAWAYPGRSVGVSRDCPIYSGTQ